ncbi:hypothetical protein [Paraburkholderia strydomiana]|uniref:Phage major capsid protein n=1 Tax=Paraburkholderia strydomiana TaxID=1245417 RepID=A0ABW9BZY3_9BURK
MDPYWRIRVGALYGEQQIVDRGQALVRSGLHSIRETIQAEGETAFLVSREQWAERLLDVLDFAVEQSRDPETRRSQLRFRADSNAEEAISTLEAQPPEVGLQDVVSRERRRDKYEAKTTQKIFRNESALDNVEHPLFQTELALREIEIAKDILKSTSIDIDASSLPGKRPQAFIRPEAIDAAVTYTRFVERAALVPSVGAVGLTAKNLASCYQIFAETRNATAGLRILYRANSGATLASADALSLPAIAELPNGIAGGIFARFADEIERQINEDEQAWDAPKIASFKFAMDLTSRIAFRLNQDQAAGMSRLAIRLY